MKKPKRHIPFYILHLDYRIGDWVEVTDISESTYGKIGKVIEVWVGDDPYYYGPVVEFPDIPHSRGTNPCQFYYWGVGTPKNIIVKRILEDL